MTMTTERVPSLSGKERGKIKRGGGRRGSGKKDRAGRERRECWRGEWRVAALLFYLSRAEVEEDGHSFLMSHRRKPHFPPFS